MPIRVGLAGAGSMGRNHARIYSQLQQAEFCAIYDPDISKAQALAQEYGGQPVTNLQELAQACDAVSVVVPTEAHLEVGRTLMNGGCHVLIEKPIASNLAEANQLVALSEKHSVVLQVGHIERFNPVMKKLEERLTAPRFIESHRLSPFPGRSLDIGVILDLMIHDLELILHLVKSPIAHLDAVGVPVLTKDEDIANVRLRFENGCIANVTASRVSLEKMRKIRVFQPEGYLSLDYQAQKGRYYWKEQGQISQQEVEIESGEPLMAELAAFLEAAKAKTAPIVTGQQGARALSLALEITNLARSSWP